MARQGCSTSDRRSEPRRHGGEAHPACRLRGPRLPDRPMSTVSRIRRKVARWADPDAFAELRATKRKLRRTRAELREARAQAEARAFGLPPEVEETIAQVRAEHLTYLKPDGLRALAAGVREAEQAGRAGLVIEAGTALGGSAIVM